MIPGTPILEFIFSRPFSKETCSEEVELEIGDTLQISSYNFDTGDGDSFLCTIDGKAFRNQDGNYIGQTVSLIKIPISLMKEFIACIVVFSWDNA